MQPPFNPVEELLRAQPSLANGPHMVYIGKGLMAMTKKNARSARRIAAAIIKASSSRCTAMVTAVDALLQANDDETNNEFIAAAASYSNKPIDDDGDIPDNIDLLNSKVSFKTFLRMAIDYVDAPIDPDQMADEMLAMSEQQKANFANTIVTGAGPWQYEKEALPVGCELR
jgi:hypothetical protein